MPFLKESPRSLSMFFVVSGILGLLISLAQLVTISAIANQAGGLNGIGQAYRIIICVFIGLAVILIVCGVQFQKVARSAPGLAPTAILIAILLKIVSIAMMPAAMFQGVVSSLVLVYLFFQYRRISGELREDGESRLN